VRDIVRTYAEEASRTKNWTVHFGGVPAPESVWTLIRMIAAFKNHVLGELFREADRLLLVGHNGWSRHAFAHLLPPGPARRANSLATGVRVVRPLNNAGVFCSRAAGRGPGAVFFERDDAIAADPSGVQPGTTDLPNFGTKAREVLLGFPLDARMARVIPEDSMVRHFLMNKAGSHTGIWGERIYTISHSSMENRSFLAWSDEEGKPRGSLRLGLEPLLGESNSEELTISLEHDGRKHRLRANSRDEFDSFIVWLEMFTETRPSNSRKGQASWRGLGSPH